MSLISLIVSQNWTDLLTYQPMSRCNGSLSSNNQVFKSLFKVQYKEPVQTDMIAQGEENVE
jgi:hypothetical protein